MEDWDLWLRIAKRYDVGAVSDILAVSHRDHGGRKSDHVGDIVSGLFYLLRKHWSEYIYHPTALAVMTARILRYGATIPFHSVRSKIRRRTGVFG
jgi:hypothetical protein